MLGDKLLCKGLKNFTNNKPSYPHRSARLIIEACRP